MYLKSPWIQAGVITFLFALAYPLLRSLPGTECTFLHYDYVGETPDGSEFCSVDDSWFLDLESLQFPVKMKLVTDSVASPGQPVDFSIQFLRPDGTALQERQLAVVHERKIHLLVINESLDDYRHVHPQGLDGGFSDRFYFSVTPQESGIYRVYADIVPKQSRSQVISVGSFSVSGAGEISLNPIERMEYHSENLKFSLNSDHGNINLMDENRLRLQISQNAPETPARLEKVMGAYAHLVAFDESGRGFAHMHPARELTDGAGNYELEFTFRTRFPGYYRVWVQVFEEGKDLFVPLGFQVKAE